MLFKNSAACTWKKFFLALAKKKFLQSFDEFVSIELSSQVTCNLPNSLRLMLDTENPFPSPVPRTCSHCNTHEKFFRIMKKKNPTTIVFLCSVDDLNGSILYKLFSLYLIARKTFIALSVSSPTRRASIKLECIILRLLLNKPNNFCQNWKSTFVADFLTTLFPKQFFYVFSNNIKTHVNFPKIWSEFWKCGFQLVGKN